MLRVAPLQGWGIFCGVVFPALQAGLSYGGLSALCRWMLCQMTGYWSDVMVGMRWWGWDSVPYVSFVHGFAVFLAEPAIFGLEIFLMVVLGLLADVFADGFDVHGADAEFTVAALPGEVVIPGIEGFDPGRGCGFELFDDFSRGVVF